MNWQWSIPVLVNHFEPFYKGFIKNIDTCFFTVTTQLRRDVLALSLSKESSIQNKLCKNSFKDDQDCIYIV